ncbi:MAG: GTP cyclohydrolase I FolE2 [Proteobacteria bacterium]|nr:GTP cyclohydrolase I FolE2 [Pseudomonadota bacterium]MBU1737747.1 GTP cyclohydrolase I FolE2 [Pseudomonadota bacterium]
MKDIQSQHDHRRISIKKVGVKNISYPISVLDKAHHHQQTVATVNMFVNLPHHFKGTHMSRFVEILNRFHGNINLESFHLILEEMKAKLQAEEAHMEIEFPYFLKTGHGQGGVGINEYSCRMHGSLDQEDDLTLETRVPIYPPQASQKDNSMPRSLGRWGVADICLRFRHFIWIEDLIKMVEEVTLHNLNWADLISGTPDSHLSVEQITKAIAVKLSGNKDIRWFTVTVRNLAEGLSTFATIEWPDA